MLESLDPPDYPGTPLPDWVTRLRSHQVRAVNAVIDAFDEVDLVILDALVGSGKTLIGELVRRELKVARATYIATDKTLQDQVLRDFSYGRVLKGRANYRPQRAMGSITCDDCTLQGGACRWCEDPPSCSYRVAKERAITAELAVLNTSMFLAAANHARFFMENELVIADECDLLEEALIKFIEFEVPQWLGKRMGVAYPVKGARKPTIISWLADLQIQMGRVLGSLGDPKQIRVVNALIRSARELADVLSRDLASGDAGDEDDSGHWVRDYETQTFKYRPVTVNQLGWQKLWRYGGKWLLMSGTVVSAEELVDSLGWQGEYRVVTVPSTFPVENRQIIAAPVADMTRRAGERDWPKLLNAIGAICSRHEGRVLVHTVSYNLAKWLAPRLDEYFRDSNGKALRPVITHSNSQEKPDALRRYLELEGAVMLSPSMARGVDLFDDRCRVQIICKCPYPSLGDRQVSSRLRLPGGELWYAVKTARDIVQMTGRGVRSKDDWCITYVMDQQFPRNIWQRYKKLFAKSFVDAVNMKADIRWLL